MRKVLFLYPTNVIADAVFERNKDAKNIDYLSYQGLVSSKAGMLDDYDLVICDECHRVGATSTRVALKEYLETHKRTKLIGLTATPQRTEYVQERYPRRYVWGYSGVSIHLTPSNSRRKYSKTILLFYVIWCNERNRG